MENTDASRSTTTVARRAAMLAALLSTTLSTTAGQALAQKRAPAETSEKAAARQQDTVPVATDGPKTAPDDLLPGTAMDRVKGAVVAPALRIAESFPGGASVQCVDEPGHTNGCVAAGSVNANFSADPTGAASWLVTLSRTGTALLMLETPPVANGSKATITDGETVTEALRSTRPTDLHPLGCAPACIFAIPAREGALDHLTNGRATIVSLTLDGGKPTTYYLDPSVMKPAINAWQREQSRTY